MYGEAPAVDEVVVALTLSERVAMASGAAPAIPQDDGTILVELAIHQLEPSALPRPGWDKPTLITKLRRRIAGRSDDAAVRYVKVRSTDQSK